MSRSATILGYSLCLALAPPLPAADLTAEDVVRSAIAGEKRQESLRQQYIYREHQDNRLLKPDGTPGRLYIDRDFEHIFLEGGFYRKLVAIDGKPLKPKQAREEEEKMRMTAAERKAAGSNKKGIHTLTSGVPLVDMVAMMDHKILREEEFGGLTCWVVQSEPKPNAVPKTQNETRALAYRYVQWIARTDRSIPRKEWEVIGEGQDTPPGSNVKLVFLRNPDGALLPQQYIWNSLKYKGKGVAFLQTQVFSDYRRFTSQTSVQFDDPPR